MSTYVAPPDEWDCSILLSNINKNGTPYVETFELPLDGEIEYWGQSYRAEKALYAAVKANWAGENIVVHVEIAGDFTLPCSRCLEETGLAIKGNMRYLFTLRRPKGDDERKRRRDEEDEPDGIPGEDVGVIGIEVFQSELDLASCIWETMILNLPEGALCREDCRGLCPVCGCDRNAVECGCSLDVTDPRLEALRGLQ
jgi:uncharacterized protein